MGPTARRRGTDSERGATVLSQVAALAVATLLVLSVSAGVAAADQQEMNDTYAVVQGDDCTEISPLIGNESVQSFYDYRTPVADNQYTNRTGQSFSSKGTVLLQRPDSSRLFLYEDRNGTLSLVFLHGSVENGSEAGSASFAISGLPDNGSWAVKDDEYAGQSNYDNWNESDGVHRVDWTWGEDKTDGGAYSGLGDEFEITIDPAFNTEAALYGDHYNGTVRYWAALSGGQADPDRTSLVNRPVTISSGGC